MKQRISHFIIFILLIIIDQVTKYWAKTELAAGGPLVLIPDVFSLQYHTNTGAVWGIMSGKTDLLSVFTGIVLIFIIFLYIKIPAGRRYNILKIIVVFIMAGAVGNWIDRIFLGYVIDFIYFELINFPLFNFADSCLTVSSLLLFLLAVFYFKDEDFAFLDQMFRRKKSAAVTSKDINAENTVTTVSDEETSGSGDSQAMGASDGIPADEAADGDAVNEEDKNE